MNFTQFYSISSSVYVDTPIPIKPLKKKHKVNMCMLQFSTFVHPD